MLRNLQLRCPADPRSGRPTTQSEREGAGPSIPPLTPSTSTGPLQCWGQGLQTGGGPGGCGPTAQDPPITQALWGPCWALKEGLCGLLLLCRWNSPIPREEPAPRDADKGRTRPRATSQPLPPAPCTPVPWSHLGQMGREPGRGPGNMLGTRCCCGAVPSQVNKLHTKHKQSAVCLAPFRGRPVHRQE